jgi:low temperature requirement protein LtrA
VARTARAILRERGERAARVTSFELFFDLVYVFAVTQLSHHLLEHLTVRGAAQTLLLLLAVWWAWMYTCWTTNWFDPDHPAIRLVLIGVMLAGLIMSAGIPDAFGDRAMWFAAAYVTIQVGRTLFLVIALGTHELSRNFQRILVWLAVPGVFWIAGGFAHGSAQAALWVVAFGLEFTGPVVGFASPVLGRSVTGDWEIDGEHMAERCRLFMIIALGESLLLTGATFSDLRKSSAGEVAALVSAFLIAVAMWWIYFDRTADLAGERIAASDDPGRLGRSAYTYVHIPMVAGIIVTAVAAELVIAHAGGHVAGGTAAVTLGGPALFVAGHALFKRVVFGHFTRARVFALAALATLIPAYPLVTPLTLLVAATLVLVVLAAWDVRAFRLH